MRYTISAYTVVGLLWDYAKFDTKELTDVYYYKLIDHNMLTHIEMFFVSFSGEEDLVRKYLKSFDNVCKELDFI